MASYFEQILETIQHNITRRIGLLLQKATMTLHVLTLYPIHAQDSLD